MFLINSFLRTPSGEFVQVEACEDRPADSDYVEGAIEIVVDGVEIVGKREWDYVDQLWSYMADMVETLRSHGNADTYYPDQPIRLEFAQEGSRVVIASQDGERVRRGSVDHVEFDRVVGAAGRVFFERMTELLPDNAKAYASAQSKLANK
mgnify:CR=1 FL=1